MSKKIRIHASLNGPYIVEGKVPICEKNIEKDPITENWTYTHKNRLKSAKTPIKLCRCGHSGTMPFCDESHHCEHFDGTCTAPHQSFAQDAQAIEGPNFVR